MKENFQCNVYLSKGKKEKKNLPEPLGTHIPCSAESAQSLGWLSAFHWFLQTLFLHPANGSFIHVPDIALPHQERPFRLFSQN